LVVVLMNTSHGNNDNSMSFRRNQVIFGAMESASRALQK